LLNDNYLLFLRSLLAKLVLVHEDLVWLQESGHWKQRKKRVIIIINLQMLGKGKGKNYEILKQ